MSDQPYYILYDLRNESVNVPEFSLDMLTPEHEHEVSVKDSETEEFLTGFKEGYTEGYLGGFAESSSIAGDNGYVEMQEKWETSKTDDISSSEKEQVIQKMLELPESKVIESKFVAEYIGISDLKSLGQEVGSDVGAADGYDDGTELGYDKGVYFWLDCFVKSLRAVRTIDTETREKLVNSMLPVDMHFTEKEVED